MIKIGKEIYSYITTHVTGIKTSGWEGGEASFIVESGKESGFCGGDLGGIETTCGETDQIS